MSISQYLEWLGSPAWILLVGLALLIFLMARPQVTHVDEDDAHAKAREIKRVKRERARRMRGNRDVYEIQKAMIKRARDARERSQK